MSVSTKPVCKGKLLFVVAVVVRLCALCAVVHMPGKASGPSCS